MMQIADVITTSSLKKTRCTTCNFGFNKFILNHY